MKAKLLPAVFLLALIGALAVPSVQAGDAKEKPVSKRDMKKYDVDKDGVLSPDEKAAMAVDKEKRKAERKAKAEAKKQQKQME